MYHSGSHIYVMQKAVRRAEKIMIRDYYEVERLQVSVKGTHDFVTSTDLRAEETVHEELSRHFPDYGFLMEEGGEVKGSAPYRFVVDALDGTFNFMHGVKYFAVSIALEKINDDGKGVIVAGIVHSPLTRETFWAEKGKGSFYVDSDSNEHRIRTIACRDIGRALLVTSSLTINHEYDLLKNLINAGVHIRIMGSVALDICYLALGRYSYLLYVRPNHWDSAAGSVILSEAGGSMVNCSGSDIIKSECILISGSHISLTKIRPFL